MLLSKLVNLIVPCAFDSSWSFDATIREGATAFLLGIHGQLSAEADLLSNVTVPVSMPTVLLLQAV